MSGCDIRPRILVADDDPILRSLVAAKLKMSQLDVVEAADGLDAWSLMQNDQIALALVDIEMPNMGGIELVQCIRTHPKTKHMPIVMVTSRDDHSSIVRALNAGATSYLTKPINWSLFSEHVLHLVRLGGEAQSLATAEQESQRIVAFTSGVLGELQSKLGALANTAHLADNGGTNVNKDEVWREMARLTRWVGYVGKTAQEERSDLQLVKLIEDTAANQSGDTRARVVVRPGVGGPGVGGPGVGGNVPVHGYSPAMALMAECLLAMAAASSATTLGLEVAGGDDGMNLRAAVPSGSLVESTAGIIGHVVALHGGRMHATQTDAGDVVFEFDFQGADAGQRPETLVDDVKLSA